MAGSGRWSSTETPKPDLVVPTSHTPSATKPIRATLFQFRAPVGAENVIWIP